MSRGGDRRGRGEGGVGDEAEGEGVIREDDGVGEGASIGKVGGSVEDGGDQAGCRAVGEREGDGAVGIRGAFKNGGAGVGAGLRVWVSM